MLIRNEREGKFIYRSWILLEADTLFQLTWHVVHRFHVSTLAVICHDGGSDSHRAFINDLREDSKEAEQLFPMYNP